jgi:hypothetical protein
VKYPLTLSIALALLVPGCKGAHAPTKLDQPGGTGPTTPRSYDALGRADFNRWAVRENAPVYWIADENRDQRIDPGEVASLLFYPSATIWVSDGQFTDAWDATYDQLVAASKASLDRLPAEEQRRLALVGKDLDQGRATLVRSDLRGLSADDKRFVREMLEVARGIDALFALQNGAAALAGQVRPDDKASQSLFRRNQGPACVAPATEKEPACSAIAGSPKQLVGVYPADLQATATFCQDLEKRPDSKALLIPFAVVERKGGELTAVPYPRAYAAPMNEIAGHLEAAAAAVKDPAEGPLVTYLRAAAASFRSNDWQPADEAWAKMNAESSKWYVRVAPDEVYWEPCAHKAGFHLTFARINQGSLAWQRKLVPVQQEMEAAIAAQAGPPYRARKVTFHLPDFIDIVVNAGDDRDPLGATIGQSLPNWGPVANEGRGRTVAMSNLYTDPDSLATRRSQAESVLDTASVAAYSTAAEPGLLSTILHEATHNLGPHSEYAVRGKTDDEIFGGPLASVYEELKAQTGALFLIDFLRRGGIIDDALAAQTYLDSIVWAFGHISEGMYTATGERKAYSQLAAIQIGFLMDHGALSWNAATPAANGTDRGAFTIHPDKLATAVNEMMKVVGGIKARGDKAAAEALVARYVDGATVPQKEIAARWLRFPKASFVYSLDL